MRLIFIAVILQVWTSQRLTDATLPVLTSFLSLKPPPPPPSPPPSQAPQQHQPVNEKNEFRLHKLMEHSTFVSTYHNNQTPRQEPPQAQPSPDFKSQVIHNFVPASEDKEAGVRTNTGAPPKRSTSFHPVPLTFPPQGSSSDSYGPPKVISFPPTTYTSSTTYSMTQGFRPIYGPPPRPTKLVRHVSVFVAPQQYSFNQRQKIRVQGDAEKHVNVIFIKSPDQSNANLAEIELPPRPEQKTVVYLLNKEPDGPDGGVIVNTPEPPKYTPPDVFYINYKSNNNGQQNQQYGVPPSQQPSTEYGAPSNQNFTYTLPSPEAPSPRLNNDPNETSIISNHLKNQVDHSVHIQNTNHITSYRAYEHHHHQEKTQENRGHQEQHPKIFASSINNILKDDEDKEGEKGKTKHHYKREQQGANHVSPTKPPFTPTPPSRPHEVATDPISHPGVRLHQPNKTVGNHNGASSNYANISPTAGDDIIILTSRNLTSGDFDEEVEGSSRNVSGRPDDFRPYQYAPTMGYNHFGVIGHKIVS